MEITGGSHRWDTERCPLLDFNFKISELTCLVSNDSPRIIAQKTLYCALHIVDCLFLAFFTFSSFLLSCSLTLCYKHKQNPNCYFVYISNPQLTPLISVLKPDTVINYLNIPLTPYVLSPWYSTFFFKACPSSQYTYRAKQNASPLYSGRYFLSLLTPKKPQFMQAVVSVYLNCSLSL